MEQKIPTPKRLIDWCHKRLDIGKAECVVWDYQVRGRREGEGVMSKMRRQRYHQGTIVLLSSLLTSLVIVIELAISHCKCTSCALLHIFVREMDRG